MISLKSVLLLLPLLNLALAAPSEKTTFHPTSPKPEEADKRWLCTKKFCRKECDDQICQVINDVRYDTYPVPKEFDTLGKVGDRCACKLAVHEAIYPPQYKFNSCKKVETTPLVAPSDGHIRGKWVCKSHRLVSEEMTNVFSLGDTAQSTSSTARKSCKKSVCDRIVFGRGRRAYDAGYQVGDKCSCTDDSKPDFVKEYDCEKQLDAGYLMENRGKHIVDNTWVCNVLTFSVSRNRCMDF